MMEVVGSVSAGVLETLLKKLAKMLTDEYKLHKGTKEGIQYIKDELESMQAALDKLSEVPPDQLDQRDKLWARQLRGMSYTIEDTIDSYMLRLAVSDDGGADGEPGGSSTKTTTTCSCSCFGCSMRPRTYKARRDIATEIERIKKEVELVSRRHERYRYDGIVQAPASSSDPRLRALYEDRAKLVGIDHSMEEIIKWLSSSSMEGDSAAPTQKLKLVSIVGRGGMGKTTLANAVYQELEGKFDCTAFASVSLQPNVKNVLSSILRQVTSKIKHDPQDKDKSLLDRRQSQKHYANTESWSEKDIIDEIRLVLKKRRYLILIDDVWEIQPWQLIQCALIENELGSKVIMTTRNIDVAKSCCRSSDKVDGIVYDLKPLSDGDSEQLFYYKIFGKDGCPTELKDVSHEILEKCQGWPLAIITIASLLANKPAQTRDQWYSVYRSISTGLENDRGVKDMRFILSLSYRDMPAQLRDCLLYLSILPEDRIIGRDDLIRRWMAEGLVRGRQDDKLCELGDKYFHELINRSMIEPIDVDAFGRAGACKVHDLVLEFINFLSSEENFVNILDGRQTSPLRPDSIYRLSLRNSKGEHGIPQATKSLPHVRTLVVSSRAISSMPSLSVFPLVRVLELEQCTKHSIRGVENLLHLRYLRLSRAYHFSRAYYDDHVFIDLPEGIGSLQLLQTLDLSGARLRALPSTVDRFTKLRVLELSLHKKYNESFEMRLLRCFWSVMKQLEDLCILAPDLSLDFMLQIAGWRPRCLRRFTASPREPTEHILRRGSVWAELSTFSTLPRWINSSLSSLSDLSIMVRTLEQADLEILACLPTLGSVDLEVVEATGTRLEINRSVAAAGAHTDAAAFPCLGKLKFSSRAAGLVFRPGAMQKLQKLYLCFDVAETEDVHGDFSFGLENLTALKTVNVEIDCRCARPREVDDVEDALRNATGLNPNRPALDLKRHFLDWMLHDEDEEINDEYLQPSKDEDTLLSRIGPFGGNGGRAHDIRRVPPHRLVKVQIGHASVIHLLGFSYTDHNGQQRVAGPWGARGHDTEDSTIQLGPSEYLVEVSGTIGRRSAVAKIITSLTFVTNTDSYGPYGRGGGDPFVFPAPNNCSIVGFFGRAGVWLDAIGFYVRPM